MLSIAPGRSEGEIMLDSQANETIRTAEEIFRAFLRGRGLKYTPERRTLLLAVLGNEDHFEADELLITLRQAGKRVAKATIYRTLPLLVDCGLIRQVQFGDKLARYEHRWGHAPHDHMVCQRCQRIIEFDNAEIARVRSKIAARYKFRVLSHRFQMTGLCRECLESSGEPESSLLARGE
jgi:Fur family ferric uptake transcriptional regulator